MKGWGLAEGKHFISSYHAQVLHFYCQNYKTDFTENHGTTKKQAFYDMVEIDFRSI
jgi:hypothetical protein